MLIIGQNEKYMANLDNAIGISITEYRNYQTGNNATIVIRFSNKEPELKLGEYKSTERAKVVLQEIIKAYENNQKNYEMPKE